MNIALIGPPGAGKGTHAKTLTTAFSLDYVSAPNLFMRQLVRKTALGILSRKYMEAGELVPDEVVDAMIEERLRKEREEEGVLLSGFPRTLHQAQFLDELLKDIGLSMDAVIYVDVAEEKNVERLLERLICRGCQTPFHPRFHPPAKDGECDYCGGVLYHRDGDKEDLIRARVRTFHRVTGPVLDYYQQQGKLVVVDGSGEIDAVYRRIRDAVQAVQQQQALPVASVTEIERIAPKQEPAAAIPAGQALHASTDLVLLGAPGSGKGTQAEHVCGLLDLKHVATGDLFRENLKHQTELGMMAKAYMDRGELVPDEVTDAMVKDRLGRPDVDDGFVLDGFPRNVHQAEALTEMENSMGRRIAAALYIKVSDDEIVSRLSGRLICRDCQTPFHRMFKPPAREGACDACGGELYQRDDDNPETVWARLKIFHAQTEPVIEYYRDAGLLIEIEGEGDVTAVTKRTLAAAREVQVAAQP